MIVPLGLLACTGENPYNIAGDVIYESFPFDGERFWLYNSTDASLPYRLEVEIFPPGEPGVLDTVVYTLRYTQDCFGNDPSCVPGTILRIIQWSSDPSQGVLIHGSGTAIGAIQTYDPPIRISADSANLDDSWETKTGGATWTSTYTGIDSCGLAMPLEWDCFTFEVTTDAGEGYPIAGKWWSARANGVATMEIATETGRWELGDLDCEPDAECDGQWY